MGYISTVHFTGSMTPQIGRFGGVDVLSENTSELSSYNFSNNNPIMFNDPSGAKYLPPEILAQERIPNALELANDNWHDAREDFYINRSFGAGGKGNINSRGSDAGGILNSVIEAAKNGISDIEDAAGNSVAGVSWDFSDGDLVGMTTLANDHMSINKYTAEGEYKLSTGNNLFQNANYVGDRSGGATTTFLVEISDLKHSDFLGGKYSLKTYAGVSVGTDGQLIAVDGGYTLDKNKKISGSITIQGIASMVVTSTAIETGFVIHGTSDTESAISFDGSFSVSWG